MDRAIELFTFHLEDNIFLRLFTNFKLYPFSGKFHVSQKKTIQIYHDMSIMDKSIYRYENIKRVSANQEQTELGEEVFRKVRLSGRT